MQIAREASLIKGGRQWMGSSVLSYCSGKSHGHLQFKHQNGVRAVAWKMDFNNSTISVQVPTLDVKLAAKCASYVS